MDAWRSHLSGGPFAAVCWILLRQFSMQSAFDHPDPLRGSAVFPMEPTGGCLKACPELNTYAPRLKDEIFSSSISIKSRVLAASAHFLLPGIKSFLCRGVDG